MWQHMSHHTSVRAGRGVAVSWMAYSWHRRARHANPRLTRLSRMIYAHQSSCFCHWINGNIFTQLVTVITHSPTFMLSASCCLLHSLSFLLTIFFFCTIIAFLPVSLFTSPHTLCIFTTSSPSLCHSFTATLLSSGVLFPPSSPLFFIKVPQTEWDRSDQLAAVSPAVPARTGLHANEWERLSSEVTRLA